MAFSAFALLAGLALAAPASAHPEADADCGADAEIRFALKELVTPTGAINTYFDADKPGHNLIDPYFGNLFFWHLLSDTKPGPEVVYAARRWVDWYLAHANYRMRDDGALELMSGVTVGLPPGYRTVPEDFASPVHPYNAAAHAAMVKNFRQLHAQGTIYRYYIDAQGHEVPAFAYFLPELSGPLESPAMQEAIQKHVFDSTDAYGATFISVVRKLLDVLKPADARYFFIQNHYRLKLIADGSFGATDPRSGLTRAAPHVSAEYTMDNAEVWAGIRDYLAILETMLQRDPRGFARPLDGFLLRDEVKFYSQLEKGFEDSITRKLQIPAPDPTPAEDDTGLFYLGWNPANSTPMRAPTGWWDLTAFDGALELLLQGFPIRERGGNPLGKLRQRFARYQGNYGTTEHLKTVWTYPVVWRYIPFARATDQAASPLSHDALRATARAICRIFIRERHRAYPYWNGLESASYAHLLRLLGEAPAGRPEAAPGAAK